MTTAPLLLRSLVLGLAVVHASALIANVSQTWDTFNPSYKGHYVRQQLLRPLVGLGFAVVLFLCETPLAAWISAQPSP